MTYRELFGDARFLMPQGSPDAALFRGTFEAKQGEPSAITICGLGYFILYINGRRVGDDEFVPPVSDYHDRADLWLSYPLNDDWSHRIYVMRYDLAPYLRDGENVLGVMVGGGFYHQTMRVGEGNVSYGEIKLAYRIAFDDREVLSDKDTLWHPGFFRQANLYHGEKHDYTAFDRLWNTADAKTDGWQTPTRVTPPKSEYLVADCPTDKVQAILQPTLLREFADYSVYALPYNCAGYPVVRCERAGETVTLECAENVNADGTLHNRSVGYNKQRQIAEFVTDGAGLFHPYFTWFGFRYFTLTNNAKPDHVRVIYTDVPQTSAFRCSDETINWFADAFLQTQKDNMHGSIPSDCPHRERLGYTGDGQLTCDAVMTQFDAERFYRKWIYDIFDCQDMHTGHVQHTAPFAGGGGGPAGWGGAIIVVPYQFYRHYGDPAFLREAWPHMEAFVRYMENHSENGLVTREEKDGWCLGDWCPPGKVVIPAPFVNTALYVAQLRQMRYCADVLGEDTAAIDRLIEAHMDALTDAYFDGTSFCGGVQGADALALDCGFSDARLLQNLRDKYTALGMFDTGIFGTPALLRVLFRNGEADLAAALLGSQGEASFANMRRGGATTLWENWNGEASHNHPMFGAATALLYQDLLGVRQTDDSVRFDKVTIAPVFPKSLDFAEGYMTTQHGRIAVAWKRTADGIDLTVDLCDGVQANLCCGSHCRPLSPGETRVSILAQTPQT